MNTVQKFAKRCLAGALMSAVAFPLAQADDPPPAKVLIDNPPIVDPVEVPPPAPPEVRVEPGAVQVRGVERTGVVVDRAPARRAFQVADIRPPDVGIWFDPAATDSLVIADLDPSGPAAQMDLEEGDRILEVNHVKVTRETDFIKLLFATKARDGRVDILLVRKNKEIVVPVEPALLREHYLAVRHDPLEQLGLVIDDRYDDRVVVWKVIPRSPAFYAGIRTGDVITRWGDQRLVERQAFTNLVPSIQPGMVAVEVNRGSRVRPLRVEVPREWSVGSSNARFPVSTDRPIDRGGARRDAIDVEPRPRVPRDEDDRK
jgi:predicted metalloprotease with PDZ domain